ncbi:hypothetical protein GUJ93_ZPchr0004g38154 [Zizania palustris]|uniref:Uncharacterized protein n=1 Tax=Zizania palustris TaxID=103762 RepID=A0A8J5SHN3_ZIZPA|nr:hypothetical protein GUJ93_ZPchr0004g38154 [Zizania palustris]
MCESEIQEASPKTDILFLENQPRCTNESPHNESDTEDGSSWETISHQEMQGSSASLDGNELSVHRICDESISGTSRNDFEYKEAEKLKDDTADAYLTNMNQPKKKESAL